MDKGAMSLLELRSGEVRLYTCLLHRVLHRCSGWTTLELLKGSRCAGHNAHVSVLHQPVSFSLIKRLCGVQNGQLASRPVGLIAYLSLGCSYQPDSMNTVHMM